MSVKKNYTNYYAEFIELSKESSQKSLRKFINIYMNSNNEQQRTARKAIKKTKNRRIIIDLIEEYLKREGPGEYQLLKLGMSLSRVKYIKRLLLYYKRNQINPNTVGFFRNLKNEVLSDAEQEQITEYIIETSDFNPEIVNMSGQKNEEKVLEAALNSVINNARNAKAIKLLSAHIEYLELIQDEIYSLIAENPEERIKMVCYLDLSREKNQILVLNYNDIFTVYSAIKENYFLDKVIYCDEVILWVAVQVARQGVIDEKDWDYVKRIVIEKKRNVGNVNNETSFLMFLKDAYYVEQEFIEDQLIEIYKESKLYTDRALRVLEQLKSRFAYREMVSFMLTSENREERFSYAIRLMRTYNENATAIYNYARELEDEKLLQTLAGVAEKYNIPVSFEEKYKNVSFINEEEMQILPHDTIISEFLLDLAKEINANTFYSAVGFTFSSGLKMLQPLFTYIHENSGTIELITGSLQNYDTNSKSTKIDKSSVLYLNNLIQDVGLKLYTFTDSFYHGKFYFLAGKERAYVVMGSSNISKTAFLDNYELDALVSIKMGRELNPFSKWYSTFRSQCTLIPHLNVELYDDYKWESELDVFSARLVHKMTYDEVRQRITELSDEQTRFRLNTWMRHNPTEIYSKLGIASLQEYIVFLYAERGLAVFESFIPGNAYYTFRYYDFDVLLQNVSALTKTQLVMSSNFVNRGYHISNKDKLEKRIDGLFFKSMNNKS